MRKTLTILPAILVVAVVLDNVHLQGCGSDAHPSSLAHSGRSYTAVWASPSSLNATVWSAQFDESDFGSAGVQAATIGATRSPERVIKVSSVRATPEVVAGDGGYLVLVLGGKGELYAIPLSGRGVRAGEPATVATGVDLLCVRPVWSNGSYFVAYGDGDRLWWAGLDASGKVTERDSLRAPPPSRCAMAAGDGRIAIVAQSESRDFSVEVRDRVLIAQVAGAGGPLRLRRQTGGWGLLYQTGGGLELVNLGDDGSNTRGARVPPEVDPGSVDLARTDRGLFFTWLDGKSARWTFAGSDRIDTLKIPSRGLGTRALGHGHTCAMTWTSDGGNKVWVMRAKRCGE